MSQFWSCFVFLSKSLEVLNSKTPAERAVLSLASESFEETIAWLRKLNRRNVLKMTKFCCYAKILNAQLSMSNVQWKKRVENTSRKS
jgi:hypothetical protein